MSDFADALVERVARALCTKMYSCDPMFDIEGHDGAGQPVWTTCCDEAREWQITDAGHLDELADAQAEAARLREALRQTVRLLVAFVNPDTDAIAKAVIDTADAALAGEARDE